MKKDISEDEWELINAIRNYKRSFPNGRFNLEWHARNTFESLMMIH